MADITIEPVAPARWGDLQESFGGGNSDAPSCQCQWWTLTNTEFKASSRELRERMLHAEVDGAKPPGLVAYVDGRPAGWVRVGPRTDQPRLALTRNYAASPEPFEAPDVWAISCFVVRREFRGMGLNARLLDAALAFATEHSARVVEGYPIDVSVRKTSALDLFHGALSTFERAGFREVARPKPHIAIVQRTLG